MTSLIEQSSKAYLENKVMTQIQEKRVDYYHLRARDNILISMKDQNDIDFIEEE